MKKSVIIANNDKKELKTINSFLKGTEYFIIAECIDGFDLVHKFETLSPDISIVSTELNLLGGIDAVKKIRSSYENSSFIFTGPKQDDILNECLKISLCGYVTKPIIKDVLISSLEVAFENGKRINSMVSQIDSYEKRLTDRKIIEKAKGLLMRNEKISEEDAYSTLRQASMDMRVPMSVIAQVIIKEGKIKK